MVPMECTGVNKVSKMFTFQPVATCGGVCWHKAGCCLVCVSEPAGSSCVFMPVESFLLPGKAY